MTKTIATIPFDIYSVEPNTVTLRDFSSDKFSLLYRRTAPVRQKDFPGVKRTEVKLSMVDPTTGVLIGTINLSSSIRADALAADISTMKTIMVGAVGDDAYMPLLLDLRLPLATA